MIFTHLQNSGAPKTLTAKVYQLFRSPFCHLPPEKLNTCKLIETQPKKRAAGVEKQNENITKLRFRCAKPKTILPTLPENSPHTDTNGNIKGK